MMEKHRYIFAQQLVEIDSVYDYIHRMCRDYLAPDVLPASVSADDVVAVRTNPEEIRREQVLSDEEMRYEGHPEVKYPEPYLETLAVYRQMCDALPARGVMLMHGSVIAVDGRAYMFTAASGTGKSTHVRLWRELFGSRAVMVNDDKPLLRVCDGRVIIYGTPWDGKHHLSTNIAVPLAGICILQRGEQNRIERIAGEDAFPMLVQQSYRPANTEGFMAVMDMLGTLAEQVPMYRLWCNMDPEAAVVSSRGMGVEI